MTIKQYGGIFGRNPTFNNATIDGTLTVDQIVEKTGAAGITLDGVTLKDGNVVLADGKGIDFSATSGTGTSELFDDYEEGTWTPALSAVSGSFASLTYSVQRGRYVKTGAAVWMGFEIAVDTVSIGTAATAVNLIGFPFARPALEDQYGSGIVTQYSGWTTAAPTVLPRSNTTSSILRYPSSATAVANMPPANVTAGCTMHGFIIIATA